MNSLQIIVAGNGDPRVPEFPKNCIYTDEDPSTTLNDVMWIVLEVFPDLGYSELEFGRAPHAPNSDRVRKYCAAPNPVVIRIKGRLDR